MPLAYQFEPKEGYLQIRTFGCTNDIGEMLQYVACIASEVAKEDIEKLLVDESESAIRLKFHEMLLNAKSFFKIAEQSSPVRRTAIVCKTHSFCLYSYLVEKMSIMTKSKLKLFSDPAAAEMWLLSDEEQ